MIRIMTYERSTLNEQGSASPDAARRRSRQEEK